jgi:hypothetical protein
MIPPVDEANKNKRQYENIVIMISQIVPGIYVGERYDRNGL